MEGRELEDKTKGCHLFSVAIIVSIYVNVVLNCPCKCHVKMTVPSSAVTQSTASVPGSATGSTEPVINMQGSMQSTTATIQVPTQPIPQPDSSIADSASKVPAPPSPCDVIVVSKTVAGTTAAVPIVIDGGTSHITSATSSSEAPAGGTVVDMKPSSPCSISKSTPTFSSGGAFIIPSPKANLQLPSMLVPNGLHVQESRLNSVLTRPAINSAVSESAGVKGSGKKDEEKVSANDGSKGEPKGKGVSTKDQVKKQDDDDDFKPMKKRFRHPTPAVTVSSIYLDTMVI